MKRKSVSKWSILRKKHADNTDLMEAFQVEEMFERQVIISVNIHVVNTMNDTMFIIFFKNIYATMLLVVGET